MAYTTIHPIKVTLGKAVDYILDKNKTYSTDNISTENCSADYAEKEFLRTQKYHKNRTENLAFHLIQSFPKGEVTPEQAMQVGMETMQEFLKGQYEFVIATHCDKGHIHNHILINSVNMVNGKSFSTEHDRKRNPAWRQVRQISDKILKEKGLSVIENPEKSCTSHYEWEMQQAGTSWKAQLKRIIDNTVKVSDNFDDFLSRLRAENITVKYEDYKTKSGKCLAFKMEGQKYFIYSQKFGFYYSEENIKKRIDRAVHRRGMSSIERRQERLLNDNGTLKRMYNLTELDGEGLKIWAKNENRKIAMQTINQMKACGFDFVEDFLEEYNNISDKITENKLEIYSMDKEITQLNKKLKYTQMYREYKPIYDTYKNSINQERYFRRHEDEIMLFKEASDELLKTGRTVPNIGKLNAEIRDLNCRRQSILDENKQLNGRLSEYKTLKENLEIIFDKNTEKERQEVNKSEIVRKKNRGVEL